MTYPERPGEITFFRIFDGIRNQRKLVLVSLLSVACSIATISLGSFAWRSYSRAILIPVVFETASGDPVTVSANDAAGRPIAAFSAPAEEVLLPRSQVRLDVVASQRLGYRKSIDPSRRRQNQFTAPSDRLENPQTVRLEDPQTHRWVLEDVLWYVNADITRNGKSTNHCIVLHGDGLALIDTDTGKTLWTFQDPDKIEWGFSPRGCPATFQPDRCAVIRDTNGDGSQEIVFSHPNKAELLCLDSSDGYLRKGF